MEPSTCGRCGGLIERDASKCPRCGRVAPALFGLRPLLLRVFPVDGDRTRPLLLGLVAVFLATMLVSQRRGGLEGGSLLGALSPDGETLFDFGMLVPVAWLQPIEPWRWLTYAFLHGGLLHILFNASALNALGNHVEHLLGSARMITLFVVSAIGGSLACTVFTPDSPVVGASAALFGFNAALIAYGYRRGGHAGADIRGTAWRWLIASFLMTMMIPNVSHAGHVGGAITGGLGAYVMKPRRAGERESDAALLCGAISVLLIAASVIAAGYAALTRAP
ncbi:MAG: rhomboid family intramembrane serine protease [Planctomycetes bacterium]|nr:rhomboid family intramembrane serine protease [Planctomycetota bacterium]